MEKLRRLARDRAEDETGDDPAFLRDESETGPDVPTKILPCVLPALAQEVGRVDLVLEGKPEVAQAVVVVLSRRADGHGGQ